MKKCLGRISCSVTFVENKKTNYDENNHHIQPDDCLPELESFCKKCGGIFGSSEYYATNQPTNQPTNLYIYNILNLISSDGEICRQGASLAMRPAVSHPFPCLFSVLLILPSSPLSFRRPKGGRISGTQRKENTKKVNVDATEILHYTSFRSE